MRSIVMIRELYGIDMVLQSGFTRKITNRIPQKFKDELMASLDIIYNADKKYYSADPVEVYKYFANKYPSEVKRRRVFDYNGLVAMAYDNMI